MIKLSSSKGRGRPAKGPLICTTEKQPEAKDIKSVIRKWRKFIQRDLTNNYECKESPIRNMLLECFGVDEYKIFQALLFSQGKYKANSLMQSDGTKLTGSSIKKEISQDEESFDIIGLLISSYNIRRLQKFFQKQIHRVAFKHYYEALQEEFRRLPAPQNEKLLGSLDFIIRISELMEKYESQDKV
eukprot:403365368